MDSNQFAILKRGVIAWENWRYVNVDTPIELMNADLRDIELPGVDLRNANLDGCNMRYADLDRADLSSTRLTNANLADSRLRGASLSNAVGANINFSNVDASKANLGDAEFSRSNFTKAMLAGADLINATIRDSNLNGAKLNKSNLTRTDFRDSQLQNAMLEDASLEGSDLRRCILTGASFNSANLSNAKLNIANLYQADLTNARLTRADLRGATGLTCEQLTQAQDWETAYRDDELACGGTIPDPSESVILEVQSSETSVTSTPPTITVTKETDAAVPATAAKTTPIKTAEEIDEAIKQRFNETPETLVAGARQARDITIVLQTILEDMRLNSPEAGQAKALLEKQVKVLDDIVVMLQSNGDKETTRKALLDLLHDVLESYLKALADESLTRGVLAAAALASLSLAGVEVGSVVAALVAGPIVGIDAKAIRKILSGWGKKKDKGE